MAKLMQSFNIIAKMAEGIVLVQEVILIMYLPDSS